MQRFILLLTIAIAGWYGYGKYQDRVKALRAIEAEIQAADTRAVPDPVRTPVPRSEASAISAFKCDGRVYCSQMTSCAEATFFLKNCPGTKMDGDNDGIPCESQWCR